MHEGMLLSVRLVSSVIDERDDTDDMRVRLTSDMSKAGFHLSARTGYRAAGSDTRRR